MGGDGPKEQLRPYVVASTGTIGIRMRTRDWSQIEKIVQDKMGKDWVESHPPLSVGLLRKFATGHNRAQYPSEMKFKKMLRSRQIGSTAEHIRNFPVLNRFFADFYFPHSNIVVEIDGNSHRDPVQREKDRTKDEALRRFGYRVFRIWASDTDGMRKIIEEIEKELEPVEEIVERLMKAEAEHKEAENWHRRNVTVEDLEFIHRVSRAKAQRKLKAKNRKEIKKLGTRTVRKLTKRFARIENIRKAEEELRRADAERRKMGAKLRV